MNIALTYVDNVAVLTWDEGENRINYDSLARLNEIFDELENVEGPLSIVLVGVGKFFSNGLDLQRFGHTVEELTETLRQLAVLLGRILVFPRYTVAALNGHTFAGGALISIAFDYRVMREDRGFWAMNEVDLGMTIPHALMKLLAIKLPRTTMANAVITGQRYDAASGIAAEVVHVSASEGDLLNVAIERAQAMAAKNSYSIADSKMQLFGAVARELGYTPKK